MKTNLLKIAWMVMLGIVGIPFSSHAQSGEWLYVYPLIGTEQSFVLDNLSKITFTEQGINLHPVNGNITALQYNNISAITFKSRTTSIVTVKRTDIKLFREADNVIIESDTEIIAVRVYNLQGKLLQYLKNQSFSTTIFLSDCPAGLYIIQIVNGQGVSAHKIIKQ